MTIELVTGVPGAGKTLYTVGEKLRKLLGTTLDIDGVQVKRRLMVGGIRDLVIEHEMIDTPKWHADAEPDPFGDQTRLPGEPPKAVPHSALNWWLWCMPGDVIVIDECQNLFRPVAAGRKVPRFIASLEVHRHYGVDFIIITQHPQLIHANVRNLIGHHEHVRRVFGGSATFVYEWDHCTSPDRIKSATARMWRHPKRAFKLYKSAEVHTKVKQRKPLAVYILLLMAVALPAAAWNIKTRLTERFDGNAAAAKFSSSIGTPRRADTPTSRVGGIVSKESPPAPVQPPSKAIAGGYCVGDICVCYSAAGFKHAASSSACRYFLQHPGDDYWRLQAPRTEPTPSDSQGRSADRPSA